MTRMMQRQTSAAHGRSWPGPHPDTVLALIGCGAVAAVLWPTWLAARGPVPVQRTVFIAHVCGLLAGYGVVVLIGLMARNPVLERSIGSDRLARWHGRGGRAVLVLVVLHAWAATQSWADSRRENLATATWHVLRLPGLIAATVATVLLVIVGILSMRAARRRVSWERWHTIHLLVYLAVALSFVHQLAGPDLAGHRVLQVLWAMLYTGVFAQVIEYRVLTPVRNATRHRMRVVAVVPENDAVVSIHIEGEQLRSLQAGAGQFFRWRFLTPDLWRTAHPFSLSASPTDNHLRLTVKALGNGSAALQSLERGTWVVAEGPYGAVTSERRTRRDVLLIAGGVGITPMRALFETMPLRPGQDLLLLYRARTRADVIFAAELQAIARVRGARLYYLLNEQVKGFTPQLFLHLVPNLLERDVYLCGPPPMAAAARKALSQAYLPKDQLHEERFEV